MCTNNSRNDPLFVRVFVEPLILHRQSSLSSPIPFILSFSSYLEYKDQIRLPTYHLVPSVHVNTSNI